MRRSAKLRGGVINTLFKEKSAVFTRTRFSHTYVFRVFVIFAESRREEEKDKRVRCTHRRVKK